MHAAIITGVSRGLGEALAVAMLERGFTVLGVGRTASPRLRSKRFHLAACDLSQPALLAAAITPPLRLIAAGKPTTVTLVNNAAVATPAGRAGHLDASAIATAAGSSFAIWLQMTWVISTPRPAPTSAIPMKYARTRIKAPTTPPARAATTIPSVFVTPTIELDSMAPRMNP